MASMKKQKGMVFHQEGARTPTGEPPSQYFAVPKSVKPRRSGLDPSLLEIGEKDESMGRASMPQSKAGSRSRPGLTPVKHPPGSNLQEENLSAESICKGVRVTLDNNSMWNEFFRCQTEMILTKQGSRMFPYCRFRISGLQPSRKYFLLMDIQPLDNSRYKWTGRSWQAAGKAEHPVKSRPFPHPDSPSTGQRWMQSPVSFYKLKVTNNCSNQDGNIVLHPMHRYVPRLHVVQTDKAAKDVRLNGPGVITFVFAQTEFMAVTSYQNSQFAQLKVDYNPFMKGLKDEGNSWGLKLKPGKDEGPAEEQHPLRKSLKSLLANHKPRTARTAEPRACKDLQGSPPAKESPPTLAETRDPCPAQKLFSEMIREAHISLRRCSLEHLGDSPSPSDQNKPRSLQSNASRSTAAADVSTSDGMGGKALPGTPPGTRSEADAAGKVEEKPLTPPNCRWDSADDPEVGGAVASDSHRHTSGPSEESTRKQKRPAPVPLPALALFLKQHLAKSKKATSKSDAPAPAVPPEAPSSAVVSAAPHSTCATAETPQEEDAVPVCGSAACADSRAPPDEVVHMFPEQEPQSAPWPSSPSCPEAGANTSPTESRTSVLSSISPAGRPSPEPAEAEDAALLPGCSPLSSVPVSAPPVVSLQADLSLPGDKAPAPSDTLDSKSSAVAADPPAMMALLPDPECSSFCFESFSPASSPEPLASLACSQAVPLDSVSFEAKQAEEKSQGPSSVFKWHTVMPSHQPYLESPFSFQPAAQSLSLAAPALLASHTPEAHMFVGSTPPPDVALPFQENEHSLPFPAELSPLQLPLSPTFSSLDGGGLSPTPSLTDLVHFFSNDDLGIGLDFASSEPVAVLCPSPSAREDPRQERSQQDAASKRYKYKKPRRHKVVRNGVDAKSCSYTSLQPNLEEVEEQLFVSFTSKEALQLHLGEDKPQQPSPPLDEQQSSHAAENDGALSLEQKIASFEKILHRDLKLMRHRQVIHPVLQEVGLKMNLLDPTLAIDLQYLGVHLPIPPPTAPLEPAVQELRPGPGKTTDVTQIKGWREKFTPAEAPPTPTPPAAEAVAAAADPQKKNLSAFCSDMLDEYLENEGRLIDQRASTFSQPAVDLAPPLAYELPAKSSSYVRTLHSVMQKQTGSSTSELISGFVPPSKRPKLSLKESRHCRRETAKQRGPKHGRPKPKPASAGPGPLDPDGTHTQPAGHLPEPAAPEPPPLKRTRKKLKPRSTWETLSGTPTPLPSSSEDMAPLDSDSELGGPSVPNSSPHKEETAAMTTQQEGGARGMTRALLRQKDLEDGVIWEGRHRTDVTEERASIALTSLFTLMGFVRENPTAPIQLACRRAPPCLNDFCRLGCVCSSLAYRSRMGHCGRPACMLGCSCLKQKVVLLKNLDGSDSSPSHHSKRRRKKRRMKMAYVLKEADSVSQPADRVRTLWRKEDKDPEPLHVPRRHPAMKRTEHSSCARIRAYRRRGHKVAPKVKSKQSEPKPRRQADSKPETRTRTAASPTGKLLQPVLPDHQAAGPSLQPGSPAEAQQEPPEEPPPKPSKRLIILAECVWASDGDRSLVLKELCERMACDQLDRPFWVRQYFISPVAQTAEGGGADCCLQYKIHISTPKLEPGKPAGPGETEQQDQQSRSQALGADEESLLFDDWQREVEPEEAELLEDERPVVGGDRETEGGGDAREDVRQDAPERPKEKDGRRRADMGLPFLTGVSPAGFLSANRKQPGETDHVVKVNGKLYPMAKVQLGKMGALHPANRLAAYLTGRVGSSRRWPSALSSGVSRPPQGQSSAPAPRTAAQACVGGNPPAAPEPPGKAPVSSSSTALAPPPALPSKGSKLYMVPVLSSSGKVPPLQSPLPASSSQKMVLYPVKSTLGVQYYRRADGQLYRLLPMSQLKPFRQNQPGQTGPLPPVLPVVVRQTVSRAPPVTSVITSVSSSTSSTSSSLTSPASQKEQRPSESIPSSSSSTSSSSSSSLPSSTSVTGDPSRPSAPQEVTPPPPPALRGPGDAPVPAPHCSVQQIGSELELAYNPSDLDESSSSDESLDVEDGDGGRDKAKDQLRKNRVIHNSLEKLRRTKMRLLFDALRTEVFSGKDKTSKVTTLQKAVQVIQQLVTLESKLRRKKSRLLKRRDRLMDTVALSSKREQSCQQVLEQPHAANQLPAARGGASAAQAVVVKPFSQAPPAPVPAPVQAVKPPLAPPAVSHNAPVSCDRQRTIPNILSRSRKPCPTKKTQVELPLLLPGQRLLALTVVTPASGVTSGSTNDLPLTNQQSHLTPLPRPSTAERSTNRLVQPANPVQQQQVPAGPPAAPPPPPPPPPPPHILLVPPGPEQSSDQSPGQGCPPETLPSCPSGGSSLVPDPGSGVRRASEEPSKDSAWESLTPLLNHGVLNQPMGGAELEEEEPDHGSWILRLDSDSDEPVGSEAEEAGPDSTPFSESRRLPGPSAANITKAGVLVPPPLLQMRVGGATLVGGAALVDASSRPMPRLVPLGLRGTPPS